MIALVDRKIVQNPQVGRELKGIDLSNVISEEIFASAIRESLHRNSAIVMRGQKLNADQFVSFGAKFGALEKHVFNQHLLQGYPAILQLSNIQDEGKTIGRPNPGEFWHTDLTYTRSPNRISILYALEIPKSDDGVPLGNTLFRSTVAAYNTLPDTVKEKLEGMHARHFHLWVRRKNGDEKGIELTGEQRAKMENVIHPIVCAHPETGEKYLFVNHAHTVQIEGVSESESESLLQYLYDHIAAQETYVHRWQVGDVVVWDNFTTQHFATLDYQWPKRRKMWRLSVAASAPPIC